MAHDRGSAVVGFIIVPLMLCSVACIIGWASGMVSDRVERDGAADGITYNSTNMSDSTVNALKYE